MRFQILGPTHVVDDDGGPVALGGPRVRALLTLLALHAGRIVGADQLVDGMYGPRPPKAWPTRCSRRCPGCAGRWAGIWWSSTRPDTGWSPTRRTSTHAGSSSSPGPAGRR
ncbi:hypothetical protein ACFQYP_38660 [Nonomuraea antimicrobica]